MPSVSFIYVFIHNFMSLMILGLYKIFICHALTLGLTHLMNQAETTTVRFHRRILLCPVVGNAISWANRAGTRDAICRSTAKGQCGLEVNVAYIFKTFSQVSAQRDLKISSIMHTFVTCFHHAVLQLIHWLRQPPVLESNFISPHHPTSTNATDPR